MEGMAMHLLRCCLAAALICLGEETMGQRVTLESIPIVSEIQRLALQQGIPLRSDAFPDDPPLVLEYDFIIVGSGPAGSVLANRLTERADWSVLLIEKGQEGDLFNEIPSLNIYTLFGNASTWYQLEEEHTACLGLDNRRCDWPSGNGIGGATLINGMLVTRGHPDDYDRWAADGNHGWSYQDVLPYFLKTENMSIPELAGSPFHSVGGPINVQYPFQSTLGKRFVQAGQELGYEAVDYNNPYTTLGFSPSQLSVTKGRRASAASAYLYPIRNRKNLHVLKGSRVTQVLIDPLHKKAYGVKYLHKGHEYAVFTRKEVIVSAGSFGSPQLLMLSGIGPAEHLNHLHIPVLQDLCVGDNLQEHLGTPALTFLINTNESFTMPKLVAGAPDAFRIWIQGNGGPLVNNGPEALGYVKTPYASNKADIELIFLPIHLGSDGGFFSRTLSIPKDLYDKTWGEVTFKEGFLIAPMNMYPRSRGTVRLRSKDPKAPPVIDGNFLSAPIDVKILIAGIRETIKVAETKVFQEIGARLYDKPVAGCEGHTFNSDKYWECVIRLIPVQFHHQSGTCRMGPDPAFAVVDPRLRVHGVHGLRVVDASIMPYVPGIHTMMPTFMIGEKAADIIKEDWDLAEGHYF